MSSKEENGNLNGGIMYFIPQRTRMCGSGVSTHDSSGGHLANSKVTNQYRCDLGDVPALASRRENRR